MGHWPYNQCLINNVWVCMDIGTFLDFSILIVSACPFLPDLKGREVVVVLGYYQRLVFGEYKQLAAFFWVWVIAMC